MFLKDVRVRSTFKCVVVIVLCFRQNKNKYFFIFIAFVSIFNSHTKSPTYVEDLTFFELLHTFYHRYLFDNKIKLTYIL